MSHTVLEIKERLMTQLDGRNEVDESEVAELVSIMETFPFTRPILEETRIGKITNDLRRKISNLALAKRVKQLIRNWQQALAQTPPVNGVPGQAAAKHGSPGVSPSPNAGRAAARRPGGTPTTSTQCSRPGASSASAFNRPGAAINNKTFPCAAANSSAAKALSQSSPASSRSSVGSPGVFRTMLGSVASPMPSPALACHATPKRQASATLGGKLVSPAIRRAREQSSYAVSFSQSRSPALTMNDSGVSGKPQDTGKSSLKWRYKGEGNHSNDDAGGRTTPVHSDRTENSRLDSDNESCSSKNSMSNHSRPHSHSKDSTVTKTDNCGSRSNERELSKANVSSRKRTRISSISPPETHSQKRIGLSLDSPKVEKVINGHGKMGRKSHGRTASHSVSAYTSVRPADKAMLSPAVSSSSTDSQVPPQSNALLRQESTSSLSSQIRDKFACKVKTTEQLIEDLKKKNSSVIVGNTCVSAKILGDQADDPNSTSPKGRKKRGRRGKKSKDVEASVPSSDRMISRDELVERFLKSSDPCSSAEDYKLAGPSSRLALGPYVDSCSKNSFDHGFSVGRQDQSESAPKDESSVATVSPPLPSRSQPVELSSRNTLEEIYAQLPPIDWDAAASYKLPETSPVTETSVGELHGDRRPGVNGMYDINGDWTTLRDVATLPSMNGDAIHVLPYVDIF